LLNVDWNMRMCTLLEMWEILEWRDGPLRDMGLLAFLRAI